MISLITQVKISDLLVAIAEGELKLEVHRQVLAEQLGFEPFSAFNRIDRNGDRCLTINEFQNFFISNNINTNIDELETIFSQFDVDKNGIVTFEEFTQQVLPQNNQTLKDICANRQSYYVAPDEFLQWEIEMQLIKLLQQIATNKMLYENIKNSIFTTKDFNFQQVYHLFDQNSKNFIDFQDIDNFVSQRSRVLSDNELQSLMFYADRNLDNVLSKEEFYYLLKPELFDVQQQESSLLYSFNPNQQQQQQQQLQSQNMQQKPLLLKNNYNNAYVVNQPKNYTSPININQYMKKYSPVQQQQQLLSLSPNSSVQKRPSITQQASPIMQKQNQHTNQMVKTTNNQVYQKSISPPSIKQHQFRQQQNQPQYQKQQQQILNDIQEQQQQIPNESLQERGRQQFDASLMKQQQFSPGEQKLNLSYLNEKVQKVEDKSNYDEYLKKSRSKSKQRKLSQISYTTNDMLMSHSNQNFIPQNSYKQYNQQLSYQTPKRSANKQFNYDIGYINSPSTKELYQQDMTKFDQQNSQQATSYYKRSPLKKTEEEFLIQIFREQILIQREQESIKKSLALMQDFNLMDAFRIFDFRGEGKINQLQFQQGLNQFGLYPSQNELYMFFNKFDIDADGSISYAEFCQIFYPPNKEYSHLMNHREPQFIEATQLDFNNLFSPETLKLFKRLLNLILESELTIDLMKKQLISREDFNIQEAFQALDQENSGVVIFEDMKQFLEVHNIWTTENDMIYLFKKFDKNKDGKISFNEFANEISPKFHQCNQINQKSYDC